MTNQNDNTNPAKYPVAFRYSIPVDETGVQDGRTIATRLVFDAFRLLAPYVDNCPDKVAAMFLAIAIGMSGPLVERKTFAGLVMTPTAQSEEEAARRFADHRRATQEATDSLLSQGTLLHELLDAGITLRRALRQGPIQ